MREASIAGKQFRDLARRFSDLIPIRLEGALISIKAEPGRAGSRTGFAVHARRIAGKARRL
jgi:hypothetical protein